MALLKPQQGAQSFNDVPDRLPAIPMNVYELMILDADVKENNAKDGYNLVVKSKIKTEGQFQGRNVTQYLATTNDVQIGRMFKACGVAFEPDGGADTSKLKGQIWRGVLTTRTYKDNGGVERESTDVREILLPSDPIPHFEAKA